MTNPAHCQVITTTDSAEEAGELAHGAVSARLAACAQVTGPITSTYWWNDQVESAQEWQVVFKTAADRYPALEQYLREHHSYDVPEVLCFPITAGNPAYLTWLTTETRPR